MSLKELREIVAPPSNRQDGIDGNKLQRVESELGLVLPSDYKEFACTYGAGGFLFPGVTVYILNPLADGYLNRLEQYRHDFQWLKARDDRFTFDIFPEEGGILPWGRDDSGGTFCWLIEGEPGSWPVIAMLTREMSIERYDVPMTTFLAKCIIGAIKCFIWGDDALLDAKWFPL